MMVHWALLMANLPLSLGKQIHVKSFVPQRQAQLVIRIDVVGTQALSIGNQKVVCYVCDVVPLGETFFVSRDKQLVRIHNAAQDLTIDWLPQ